MTSVSENHNGDSVTNSSFLDEILRAKPSAAKGRYVKKVTVSATMGPGIPVDPQATSRGAGEAPE